MKDIIDKLIVEYTKKGETKLLKVCRMVKAEFQKASKSGKSWDPVEVLLGMISARKDSVSQYVAAGRLDLAGEEEFEIGVITRLLPPMPTEEEMVEGIMKAIKDLGRPAGMKDTKTILASLKPRFPGISGKLVSDVIKSQC